MSKKTENWKQINYVKKKINKRKHLHVSPCLFTFICYSFHPFCAWSFTPVLSVSIYSSSSSSCFLYVPLQLLCRSLSFFCMYIFRSRVIKSAPAGICWNRIFLILPCPHGTIETQICINTCVSENTCKNAWFVLIPIAFFYTYLSCILDVGQLTQYLRMQ